MSFEEWAQPDDQHPAVTAMRAFDTPPLAAGAVVAWVAEWRREQLREGGCDCTRCMKDLVSEIEAGPVDRA